MTLKTTHCYLLTFISTFFLMCSGSGQSGVNNPGYQVVFPLNDYLTITDTAPYPVLVEKKLERINTRDFINVMDYGAASGKRNDDAAIEAAFAACKPGGG